METVSLPFATVVMQILGLPGLIFIVWYFDHKAQVKQREEDRKEYEAQREELKKEYQKQREQAEKQLQAVLAQYKEDVQRVTRMYENNVHLVADYEKAVNRLEKVAGDMLGVISLNTKAMEGLVGSIENNNFCPSVRAAKGQ
jgi:multidrug resistance efflux pump